MTAENAAIAGATDVRFIQNTDGVGKTWFYTSSANSPAAASSGLAGAIAVAIVDAIINAGPSARATRVANELAAAMPLDAINEGMQQQLLEEVREGGTGGGVSISAVTSEAMAPKARGTLDQPDPAGRLIIQTSYVLSEDATTLRVSAFARYNDPATPWKTPYTFARAVPKEQLTGPAYANSFTYYSDALAVPALTPEFKKQLEAAVETAARDASGNLPKEGSSEYRKYQRELGRARDDEFSKDEVALFLTVEWTKNDGERLRQHMAAAHDFFARYLVIDINDPTVPDLNGVDQRVETLEGDRTVRRVGSGVQAGSFISSPGNVSAVVTFGNTVSLSDAAEDRAAEMNRARPARAAKK